MKTALYGRILFGASAILFGVIALLWHDPDTWQTLSQLWKLPLGSVIGAVLMVAVIFGGLAMLLPRTAHLASIILAAVFALFSLACVPAIIRAPGVYYVYGSFFEQFSILSGAIAVFTATEATPARAVVSARFARICFGLSAVSFTLSQIIYPRVTADLVPKWIPPNQMFWAVLTTIAFALAAIAILINRKAQLAARLLAVMLAIFAILVWIPRLVAHPQAHGNWSEFALTLLITAAAWMVSELKPVN